MTADRKSGNGWTTIMRWAARLLALVAASLFVLFAVETGPRIFSALSWSSPQGMPLLLGVLIALVGGLIGWRWELIGGVMAVGGSAAIVALVCAGSGFELFQSALLFITPFLLAGALYLGCCWRKRTTAASYVPRLPGLPRESLWHG